MKATANIHDEGIMTSGQRAVLTGDTDILIRALKDIADMCQSETRPPVTGDLAS